MPKLTACKPAAPSRPARIRWGIIGTGNISGTHIAALQQLPEVEIVAGCDIRPEREAWFKRQPGCVDARFYHSYDEMLRRERLDVADVCTPNGVHAPASIAALKAGCHVMTEKPMAMDPAECERMCAAAKKAQRLLAVGFQIRYSPGVQMCRRAVENGLIGDILYVKIHAMRRRGIPNWGVFGRKELQGGGPLIDIGVHQIEAAHYAMGEPRPVAAAGRTWTFLGDKPSDVLCRWPGWDYKTYTVEDLAVGQIRFENGALMQIESAFASHCAEDSAYWELMGTKGGFNTRDNVLATDMAGTMVNAAPGFLPVRIGPADVVDKLRNFANAIRFGTPLCVPGEEGLAVQKMLDGLYRSAANGGAEVTID